MDRQAECWKARYQRQRAARRALKTVSPVPTQVTTRTHVETDILNPNLFFGMALIQRAARLMGCAEDALGIVLKRQPQLVFAPPFPMSSNALWFAVWKDLRAHVSVATFPPEDLALKDAALTLEIVESIETWLRTL